MIDTEMFRGPLRPLVKTAVEVPDDLDTAISEAEPSHRQVLRRLTRQLGLQAIGEEREDYYRRLAEKAQKGQPDIQKIEEAVDPRAQVQGSVGLGINLPGGKSDIDVQVPVDDEEEVPRKIEEIQQRYPDLSPSPYNRFRSSTQVLQGPVEGEEADVVVTADDRSEARQRSYQKVREGLSDVQRGKIIDTKQSLNDAFVLSDPRYNRYKKTLDNELGIVRL